MRRDERTPFLVASPRVPGSGWLMDAGADQFMISFIYLTTQERSRLRVLDPPLSVRMANRPIVVIQSVELWVGAFK
jgi:hypothetical protein